MPKADFVIARTEDEARILLLCGFGVGTLSEASSVLANMLALTKIEAVPLAPAGDYGIFAVNIQVKRLDVDVGSA
jgi:hypothetical protein